MLARAIRPGTNQRFLFGFHRIDQRDRALMNVIASGAFQYSDV
jgi:hypothetical protein